jgi:hypothetical protein
MCVWYIQIIKTCKRTYNLVCFVVSRDHIYYHVSICTEKFERVPELKSLSICHLLNLWDGREGLGCLSQQREKNEER